jgi:hypothetical protein
MRKALIVGIDFYEKISPLFGCVNDAYSVKSVLDRNSDGSVNFSSKLITSTNTSSAISRKELKNSVEQLFEGDSEIALFYFAGHGYIESSGGYLCASDCETGDDGLSLHDVIHIANKSKAKNKIIILDSCHSGIAGCRVGETVSSELTDGMTILTASTDEQYSQEQDGSGVFTTLLVDALSGAASNLMGEITPGSVYAHIDQSLGAWEQRPVFKTNVRSFVSLRKIQSPIEFQNIMKIVEFFPEPGFQFQLDPSYEPDSPNPNPENNEVFAILQKLNRINLVVPVGAEHMYYAAMHNKSCKLTVLGEHYRRLVEKELI